MTETYSKEPEWMSLENVRVHVTLTDTDHATEVVIHKVPRGAFDALPAPVQRGSEGNYEWKVVAGVTFFLA